MNQKVKELLKSKGENYIFPFFWQHGEDEKTLRKYMEVIADCHIGAVCIESRPHPDFAGPEWWRDMDIILDEAKKREMKVWILDDSHFPTGYANGAVKDADVSLCRQCLVYQSLECPESGKTVELSLDNYKKAAAWRPTMIEQYQMQGQPERIFEDDMLFSITAVKYGGKNADDLIDLRQFVLNGKLAFRVPEGKWKIYICHLTRNRGLHRNYINMLDRASCRLLIDAVYEPHYKRYAKDFGNTIAGFFSDEPELGNGHLYETGKKIYEIEDQAWSREVEEELRRRWKGEFFQLLPLLWEENFDNNLKARVRYDYMNTLTRIVERDFSRQTGDWCREHGVKYIGHIIEDNHQHSRTGSSLGHYFRGLAGQDMAGIDDIGGQVLPQGEWIGKTETGEERDGEFYHYILGKLGASAAAVDPLKNGRSMCEIFGNYGWEEGVRLEKYLIDHFLVRGINHFVPHAFSPKEFPDADCPPHFYAQGHNPQYRHFGKLMQYTNRICHILNGGQPVVPVAILYNAEADWTGKNMYMQKPARELYDRQIDYMILPADIFTEADRYGTELSDMLTVGKQKYKVLIVPEGQFITRETAAGIYTLLEKGCRVYFINSLPEGVCNGSMEAMAHVGQCAVVPLESLADRLCEDGIQEVEIMPADNRIRCYHYWQENDIYFLTNEGTEAYHGCIRIPNQEPFYVYNAWDNCLEKREGRNKDDRTEIDITIEPNKSLLILFDQADERFFRTPLLAVHGECGDWSSDWERSICISAAYPDFEQKTKVNLPDRLEMEQPYFSGFVRYEKAYDQRRKPEKAVLEISDAYEGVEAFANGQSAGIQVVPPFRFDLTDLLIEGENRIVIEVATSLERQMAKIPDPIRLYMGLGEKKPTCPSGINGTIKWNIVY